MSDEDKSARVAYVFDTVADKDALKAFEEYLDSVSDTIMEEGTPCSEPLVQYTFKAYRDQYELAEFQRGPNYGRATDQFGRWLRDKHKYAPDGMSDEVYAVWDTVWETWCNTLADSDAVSE